MAGRRAIVGMLTCLAAAPVAAPQGQGLATVHLADGSSVPLTEWALAYDHLSWAKGTPQHLARSHVVPAAEVWVDKDRHPVGGSTLELVYEQPKGTRAPLVKQMLLTPTGGKARKLEPKPPHKDLLAPGGDKDILYLARTLDLSGKTLTGTPRTFCLVTYTSLVECGTSPESKVISVQFQ
jgi:hypothetical protein